jgi:serine phosphatase RsbU (regulator of sigma subunit)
MPDETYETGEVIFHKGDTLVIYSDGLVDARPDLSLHHTAIARSMGEPTSAEAMLMRLITLANLERTLPDDLTIAVLHCCGHQSGT